MKRCNLQTAAGILLLLVFFAGNAHAHRVIIFAWIDGQTVHTVSKFPGGKKVAGSPVIVYDKSGDRLLAGKTDDKGSFSFEIPKNSALDIVLEAGAGHQAEWHLTGQEISAALGKEVDSSPSTATKAVQQKAGRPANDQSGQSPQAKGVNAAAIQSIVEKTLDRKMAPMMQILVDMHDPGPSITEIMGGIGYIIGLFGIVFYFAARKKTM